jgi:hypothetical protein
LIKPGHSRLPDNETRARIEHLVKRIGGVFLGKDRFVGRNAGTVCVADDE